jgi:methionyl-tRNA synthetase
MLKTLNLRLPNHIIAHGFIMAEDGRKMSKTFGNVVDPVELYQEFGSDTVRYYFTKAFLIDSDNNFSKNNIKQLYNNDLANTYGNLISRFLGMCNQYNGGVINKANNTISDVDGRLLNEIETNIDLFEQNVNKFNISQAIENVFMIAQAANKYVEETKP